MEAIPLDSHREVRRLGLRYVSDSTPGITRVRRGKHFKYLSVRGEVIRAPHVLQRIASLVIPPAWTDVWICPEATGHIQATGRDAKRRKQYKYHADWRAHREATKFGHMIEFGGALHRIRARTEADLRCNCLCKEKVLAAVVQLLERTLIRVGNEEYARANQSFGLTTLRDGHVDVKGARLRFHFRGKSGKTHTVDLHDRRLAKIVGRCQDLPGDLLFHYLNDDGTAHHIGSADVNDYLRAVSGEDFTAKDFRTWAATVLAVEQLTQAEPATSKTQGKKVLVQAVAAVAQRLGNTPTVCRKSYIHPSVPEAFLAGGLELGKARRTPRGLSPLEHSVLAFLKRCSQGRGRALHSDTHFEAPSLRRVNV